MSKKYGITTGVLAVTGWIEPDGTFFPCAAWKHEYAADMIARRLYGETPNGTLVLERRGWVRCTPPQLHCTGHITEAQLATAWEVIAFNGNEVVNAQMRSLMRLEYDEKETRG